MKASLEKLAHLIKICGLLLQTKVYLFWSKTDYPYKRQHNFRGQDELL